LHDPQSHQIRAVRVVAYTVATRRHRDRERFPLTAGWIMRVSRRLGFPVGRDRAYEIRRVAIEEFLEPAGSYPQRRFGVLTGFRVQLWRAVATRLRPETSSVPDPRPWWRHSLFGLGVSTYPGHQQTRLRGWRESPWVLQL
jgi:hypothetical protein